MFQHETNTRDAQSVIPHNSVHGEHIAIVVVLMLCLANGLRLVF